MVLNVQEVRNFLLFTNKLLMSPLDFMAILIQQQYTRKNV